MKRSRFSVLLAILMIVAGLSIAVSGALAQNAAPADSGKTAEQVFKNIQMLKGVPAEQVQPTMQFITSSLGVNCQFCHVQDAFEKDDKKQKQTARQMIEMEMAINKANFKGKIQVTCFSCHRGSHDPVGVPIIADADAEPKRPETSNADASQPALPTADQVLDKYIQALGGADAIKKITSRTLKGTIAVGPSQFPVEVLAKAPDKRIATVHTPNGDSITAFDGHTGWLGNPGPQPPHDMTSQETQAMRFDATFYLPLELKSMFKDFRVRPSDKIAGHDAVQLIAINPDRPPVRLFFDKDSGLLLRLMHYDQTPLGNNPVQVDYADYRSQSGVKVPYQWTNARPRGRFTIQLSEVQMNAAIDDARFQKPPATSVPAEQKPAPR